MSGLWARLDGRVGGMGYWLLLSKYRYMNYFLSALGHQSKTIAYRIGTVPSELVQFTLNHSLEKSERNVFF